MTDNNDIFLSWYLGCRHNDFGAFHDMEKEVCYEYNNCYQANSGQASDST